MAKKTMNRAQRRRVGRDAKAHVPAFWDSVFNRVAVIGLGVAFLGIIVYSIVSKQVTAPAPKPPAPAPATIPVTPTKTSTDSATNTGATPPAQTPETPNPADKVTTEDIKIGTGPEVKVGDTLTVHYTGTLTNGTKFDSSRDKGTPLTFTVGKPGIIQGWSQGVIGMKEGGRRKLVIPPSLGYGAAGNGPKIPPNSTLDFDIEVLKIVPQP